MASIIRKPWGQIPALRGNWRKLIRVLAFTENPYNIYNIASEYHPVPRYADTTGSSWKRSDLGIYHTDSGGPGNPHNIAFGHTGRASARYLHLNTYNAGAAIVVGTQTEWVDNTNNSGTFFGAGGSASSNQPVNFLFTSTDTLLSNWGNSVSKPGDARTLDSNFHSDPPPLHPINNEYSMAIRWGGDTSPIPGTYWWTNGARKYANTTSPGGRSLITGGGFAFGFGTINGLGDGDLQDWHVKFAAYFDGWLSDAEMATISGDPVGALFESDRTIFLGAAGSLVLGVPYTVTQSAEECFCWVNYQTCLSYTQDQLPTATTATGQQIRRRPLPSTDNWTSLHRALQTEINDLWDEVGQKQAQAVNVTSDASIGHGLVKVDTTAGDVEIRLPPAATYSGDIIRIKKMDPSVNAIIITPTVPETIDDETTQIISTQYTTLQFMSDGKDWFIV